MTKTRRDALVISGGLAAAAATGSASAATPADQRTVLITGANRGLGLEFVKQYQARKYRIIATARHVNDAADLQALAKKDRNIAIETLDVTDLASIDALAAKLKGTPIDILINNAGVIGLPDKENLGSINYAHFDSVLDTNVRGPLKMSEAFLDNVAASKEKKLVVVTSVEGSIASVRGYARPFYRASKAALNMVMRNVAMAVKDKGVLVGMVCPGGTDTDMVAMYRGVFKMRKVDEAVHDMIGLIDALNAERSGVSYNFDGTVMPW